MRYLSLLIAMAVFATTYIEAGQNDFSFWLEIPLYWVDNIIEFPKIFNDTFNDTSVRNILYSVVLIVSPIWGYIYYFRNLKVFSVGRWVVLLLLVCFPYFFILSPKRFSIIIDAYNMNQVKANHERLKNSPTGRLLDQILDGETKEKTLNNNTDSLSHNSETPIASEKVSKIRHWAQQCVNTPEQDHWVMVPINHFEYFNDVALDEIEKGFSLPTGKGLDLFLVMVAAQCPQCVGVISGEQVLSAGAYQKAKGFMGNSFMISLVNGSCPGCGNKFYNIKWIGGNF